MKNKLNGLLSDLVVFYHKLQSYHWYVSGFTFFQAHEKLEEYYDGINEQIDEVAELMLQVGLEPVATLKEFSALSQIQEAPAHFNSNVEEIFATVNEDFKYLLASAKEIKELADEEANYLVSASMDELIASYSKNIWMISQTLKK